MASCDRRVSGDGRVELSGDKGSRNRSKSFTEQRPQPKPRPRARKTNSVLQNGYDSTAVSVSADSSPQLSRPETKNTHILRPTPLVTALSNSRANSQQQNNGEKSPNKHVAPPNESKKSNDSFTAGNDVTVGVKNLKLHGPIIHRQRANSEPRRRDLPPRPPPPSYPPPPNPILSRLISDNQALNTGSGTHVIDSRSKTPPARHPDFIKKKTTKYGTPPPCRPAPPPPLGKASPKKQVAPVPKPRNSPVSKLRTPPLPKPRSAVHIHQSALSSPTSTKSECQDNAVSTCKTRDKVVAAANPDYEDLDKEDNDYEILEPISPSEDDEEMCPARSERDNQGFNGEVLPLLPPKNRSKAKKGEEELPPLPPRTQPVTNNKRRHHLLVNHSRVEKTIDSEELKDPRKIAAAEIQETGSYEPMPDYLGSSDGSQDSYTKMDCSFDTDKDEPEPIYITMDPDEYIPPPDTYKK